MENRLKLAAQLESEYLEDEEALKGILGQLDATDYDDSSEENMRKIAENLSRAIGTYQRMMQSAARSSELEQPALSEGEKSNPLFLYMFFDQSQQQMTNFFERVASTRLYLEQIDLAVYNAKRLNGHGQLDKILSALASV
jgi:hypothetical protein